LVLLLGVVAGCATKADVRDLRGEILELSSQQQALLRELQEAQQDQEDSISEVARALQDIRAESFSRMSSIEDQLLTIQELAGLSQQQVASLRDQMERDRAQRSFGPPRAFGSDAAGGEDQVREVYDAALSQYQRGTLGAARLGFRQIVDQYGSNELAPEARYYLAEILQREGSLEEAIEAFNEIAQFHPTAPRVPDALYRVGLLHLELGNREEAEQSLERVVNTWPDSMAADLARDELRDL
jgi:tol-pal system protein YbgF